MRTFYTVGAEKFRQSQLFEFKVRDCAEKWIFNVDLLRKEFDTDENQLTNNAGGINVYINRKAEDGEYYFLRFGRQMLPEPVNVKKFLDKRFIDSKSRYPDKFFIAEVAINRQRCAFARLFSFCIYHSLNRFQIVKSCN